MPSNHPKQHVLKLYMNDAADPVLGHCKPGDSQDHEVSRAPVWELSLGQGI